MRKLWPIDVAYSRHHRRPQSLGGTTFQPCNNIAWIPHPEHVAWHKNFRDYWPEVIGCLINTYFFPGCCFVPFNVLTGRSITVPPLEMIVEMLLNKWEPNYEAWDTIFMDMTPSEVEQHMALRLLDPTMRFHVFFEAKTYSFASG